MQLSMLPGILSFWWAADVLASIFKVEGGTDTLAAAAAAAALAPASPSGGGGGGRINRFGASMKRRATSFVDWARWEPLVAAARCFGVLFSFTAWVSGYSLWLYCSHEPVMYVVMRIC